MSRTWVWSDKRGRSGEAQGCLWTWDARAERGAGEGGVLVYVGLAGLLHGRTCPQDCGWACSVRRPKDGVCFRQGEQKFSWPALPSCGQLGT